MRIAINGFGRIGRLILRAAYEQKVRGFKIVAINDLTDTKTLAHLLKYDSVHGRFKGDIGFTKNTLIINGKSTRSYSCMP